MIEHFHYATIMMISTYGNVTIGPQQNTIEFSNLSMELSRIYTNISITCGPNKKNIRILMAYISLCNKCHKDKRGNKTKEIPFILWHSSAVPIMFVTTVPSFSCNQFCFTSETHYSLPLLSVRIFGVCLAYNGDNDMFYCLIV